MVAALSLVVLTVGAAAALAQSSVNPAETPVKNTGGWVYGMAWLVAILAFLVVIMIVVGYMRYAPRFAKDEESARVVHADRVIPGREPLRRAVDLSQAVPIVVQPPALPMAVAAVGAPAPAPAAVAAAAPTVAAPAPAAPPAAAPTPAAPPAEVAPAATPAPAAPPLAAPAAHAERVEVTMDQEVYDATLAELVAQGTDRRIAEGKARRAGMIAARKKAEGEG